MDFMTAVRTCLSKYVDFTGRARRSEFWYFFLFSLLVQVVASILDSILGTDFDTGSSGLISTIASLGLFLPSIAVSARRLHDIGKSGWWQLLAIIPIIGWIIVIIWYCTNTKPGANQYGPDPKNDLSSAYPPPPPPAPYGSGDYGSPTA
jgi:uncharacterized membrane protein YhaH (DUF805 family)